MELPEFLRWRRVRVEFRLHAVIIAQTHAIIRRIMANPDFAQAVACLQENLQLLMDAYGNVAPQNMTMFNLSNALLVFSDALEDIQIRVKRLEQRQ